MDLGVIILSGKTDNLARTLFGTTGYSIMYELYDYEAYTGEL